MVDESKKEALISIIVANYNNGKYILQCLESILEQSYRNIQLIIVDDGSSDDSRELINSFIKGKSHDFLINSIYLDKNFGSGIAKERGLQLVKGEYCCFVDSDDYLDKHAFSKLIPFLDKNRSIALICSNAYKINSTGQNLGLLNYCRNGEDMLTERVCFHLAIWRMHHYNLLVEKFNSHFKIAHDIDLFMKLEEVGGVMIVNLPLYYYRLHGNNISLGFDRLGFAYAERLISRYEATKRRNKIDLHKSGYELQALLIKYTKKNKNISLRHLIKSRLKSYLLKYFKPPLSAPYSRTFSK
jgi:glycosyltransferase involved in cell wall biosynthesis